MKRFEKLIEEKNQERRELIAAVLPRVEALLAEAEVPYQIFGSVRRGDIRAHSDIDIMILGTHDHGLRISLRRRLLEIEVASGVPIDVLFEQEHVPETVAGLLAE